jgi:hypothetical protein
MDGRGLYRHFSLPSIPHFSGAKVVHWQKLQRFYSVRQVPRDDTSALLFLLTGHLVGH